MNDATPADRMRKKFEEIVQNYPPNLSGKLQKLLPFREGIAELRHKGASYASIVGILRDMGVKVSRDTLTRFCCEVLTLAQPHAEPRRKSGRIPAEEMRRRVPKKCETMAEHATPRGGHPAETRQTGPRIADPNTI